MAGSSLMDEAMRMNADDMVDFRPAKPAVEAPSPLAVASNPEPTTGQAVGTSANPGDEMVRYATGIVELAQRMRRGDLIVSTCGKCAKVYTLEEFLRLPPCGMPGGKEPKYWRDLDGVTLELRNCDCHSTITRVVPQ